MYRYFGQNRQIFVCPLRALQVKNLSTPQKGSGDSVALLLPLLLLPRGLGDNNHHVFVSVPEPAGAFDCLVSQHFLNVIDTT